MIVLQQPEENMGGERRTNKGAIPVDEQLDRRASNFLLIERLTTKVLESILSRRVGDRGLVCTNLGSHLPRI